MKIFGLVIIGILLLGLAGLLAFLIPHHMQIRDVGIVIPAQQEVLALRESGSEMPVDVALVTTAEQKSGLGIIGHVAVLVTWADGKQLAIDSGMNRADAVAFGETMETLYGANATQAYGPVEEQLQDAVNDVKAIVFTHLHSDHTQGITAICAAQTDPAVILQTADQASLQNHLTADGQRLIDESNCASDVLSDEMIKPVTGFPGVFAIAAGGHTPGSTIYVVNTQAQQYVFSGDLTNAMYNIQHNEGKGFLYSYMVVPENTVLLEAWRQWLLALDNEKDVLVLPAHDIAHMRAKGLRELTCTGDDC